MSSLILRPVARHLCTMEGMEHLSLLDTVSMNLMLDEQDDRAEEEMRRMKENRRG